MRCAISPPNISRLYKERLQQEDKRQCASASDAGAMGTIPYGNIGLRNGINSALSFNRYESSGYCRDLSPYFDLRQLSCL
ncbi:hypothetical protein PSAC2689_120252 [Paraburkholderia sacchari]